MHTIIIVALISALSKTPCALLSRCALGKGNIMTNEERMKHAHRILEIWWWHEEPYNPNSLEQAKAVFDFVEKIVREDCARIASNIARKDSVVFSLGGKTVADDILASIPKDAK